MPCGPMWTTGHRLSRYHGDMTGNIRNGLGLLVFAALAALVGFVALAADAPDAGAMILLGGGALAVIGLLRIGTDLLGNNTPQRD